MRGYNKRQGVTILVLLELTLQLKEADLEEEQGIRHNPCFIRINFAILSQIVKR